VSVLVSVPVENARNAGNARKRREGMHGEMSSISGEADAVPGVSTSRTTLFG
jgi:hypothetical protein